VEFVLQRRQGLAILDEALGIGGEPSRRASVTRGRSRDRPWQAAYARGDSGANGLPHTRLDHSPLYIYLDERRRDHPKPAEYEERLQKYLYERSEEGRAVRVGEKETSEQAAIVGRYADLFSREQLASLHECEDQASGDERERLYRLRKTCEGGLAAAELAEPRTSSRTRSSLRA
jgi:hypothetical protein